MQYTSGSHHGQAVKFLPREKDMPWWAEDDIEPELLAFSNSLPEQLRAGPLPYQTSLLSELDAREQAWIEVNAGLYLEYLPFEVSEYEDIVSWQGVIAQPSMSIRIPGTSHTVFLVRLKFPVRKTNQKAVD